MALRGTTINPTLSEDATAETEAERKKREKAKAKSKASEKSAGQSASAEKGGSFGKVGGGGGLIGTALQIGAGFVDMNAQKKAARRAENRPERRRLTAALGKADERKKNRKMALATLSQAVFDWAAAIR